MRRSAPSSTGKGRRGVARGLALAAMLLAPAAAACGAAPGESGDGEAAGAPRPAEASAARRAPEPRPAEARAREPSRPERAPAVRPGRSLAPRRLDDARRAGAPHEPIPAPGATILEPLEGAHYVLERGSEVEVVGERPRSVAGELSLVHCALRDPEDPARGRDLWMGGLRVEGAPLFEGRIERRREIPVLGREVRYSGRWNDLHEQRGRLTGFGRTLDAEINEEGPEAVRIWRRDLLLDPEGESTAAFERERDACPLEMTLELRVEDRFETWELVERGGELHPSRAASRPRQTIAWATLVARWVSPDPEIIDPAQRGLRARSAHARPAASLPRREVEIQPVLQDPQIRRIAPPERAVPQHQPEPR